MINCKLEEIVCVGNVLHLKGFGYIVGQPVPDYGIAKFTILAASRDFSCKFNVGSFKRKDKENVAGTNYLCSGFMDYRGAGIDIQRLPFGTYKLRVKIQNHNISEECNLPYLKKQSRAIFSDKGVLKVTNIGSCGYLSYLNPVGAYKPNYFKISTNYFTGKNIGYSGQFIVYGQSTISSEDVDFILVLTGRNDPFRIVHFAYLASCRNLNSEIDVDGLYHYSCFATDNDKGVDVSNLENGSYDVYISMLSGPYIWSQFVETITI